MRDKIMSGITKIAEGTKKLKRIKKLKEKNLNTGCSITKTIDLKSKFINVDLQKIENSLKVHSLLGSEYKPDQKRLIEGWKNIVFKQFSLREKLFYFLHFKMINI